MYKVSLNKRVPISRPVQARRTLTTSVRKGGISKLLAGGLFLSAAGMAYYQRYQKDNEFYNGDSDPYARTKKTLSNATDKLIHDEHSKEKASGAIDELGYAGQHIKNSAELAADAARGALSSVEKEGKAAVNSLKDESKKLKNTVTSEADKLLSKPYVKEGDRSPEEVLSHTTHDDITTADHVKSTINKKTGDANEAAFNAANKLKKAKETVTNEIEKDINKVTGFFKSEKENTTHEHNPMVHEKVSSDKTKPSWESRLEKHATEKVHDTTSLVEKDTEKVKQVWDDKTTKAKTSLHNVENDIKSTLEEKTQAVQDTTASLGKDIKSSLFSLFGSSDDTTKDGDRTSWETRLGSENVIPRKTDQDIINSNKPATPEKKGTSFDYYQNSEKEGNPMVLEKRSAEKTKPLWESSLENHAQEVVHDTSTLVDKDTEKVKQGVWDAKSIANEKNGASISHQNEQSSGSSFWSSLFGTEKKVRDHAEEAQHKWEGLKTQAEITKNDVKENAAETWKEAKDKAANEVNHAKNNVTSTINDLSNKSSKEATRLQSDWNSLKKDASHEAEQASKKVKDTANSVADRATNVYSDVANAAKEAKNEGSRLTRQASNHIAGGLNEVTSKAEDTAKSWYQKGTEQVKSTIINDVNWVEEKLHNGKEEVDRILGFGDEGHKGRFARGEHEISQLKATRDGPHVGLKPAEVVVEQAHGKDM